MVVNHYTNLTEVRDFRDLEKVACLILLIRGSIPAALAATVTVFQNRYLAFAAIE